MDVSRLFNYAADEVELLAAHVGSVQRPQIAAPRRTDLESLDIRDFSIGQLTPEDRAAIPLRSPKPLLLRPTLLNEQTSADDLGLEPKLRAHLREASFSRARGGAAPPPVVFVEADELRGAIRPSGIYAVEDGRIRVKLALLRDGSRKELAVEGSLSDLDGLADSMVRAILTAASEFR